MKRLLFVCVLSMTISFSYASQEVEISDARINRNEVFEEIKKWIVTSLDVYDANILYEDKSNGSIVVKGKYQHKENYLTARILDFVVPYVIFQVEVQCFDGKVVGSLRKIEYTYVTLNQSAHGLNNRSLKTIISELETIKNMMIDKGEEWIIDEAFEEKYKELKKMMDEAERNKDDISLPKTERKKWKKYYENKRNKVKLDIYEYAVDAKSDAEGKILKKNNDCLYDVVNKYLQRK